MKSELQKNILTEYGKYSQNSTRRFSFHGEAKRLFSKLYIVVNIR